MEEFLTMLFTLSMTFVFRDGKSGVLTLDLAKMRLSPEQAQALSELFPELKSQIMARVDKQAEEFDSIFLKQKGY